MCFMMTIRLYIYITRWYPYHYPMANIIQNNENLFLMVKHPTDIYFDTTCCLIAIFTHLNAIMHKTRPLLLQICIYLSFRLMRNNFFS